MIADAVLCKVKADVVRDMIKNYEVSYDDLDNDDKTLVDYFDDYERR